MGQTPFFSSSFFFICLFLFFFGSFFNLYSQEYGRRRLEKSFSELRQPRKEWRHGARASTSLLTFSSSSSTSWLPNFTKVTLMQFRSTVNSSLTKLRRTTKERRWRPEITSAK